MGLLKRGMLLWLRPQMVVRQDRGPLTLRELLRERFQWGWVYGAKRAEMMSRFARAALIILSPAIPLVRLVRLAVKVLRGGNRRPFLFSLPYLLLLTLAWSLGELYGYLKPALIDIDQEVSESAARFVSST
jgi:hypothetical protein